jgi:cell division protein FtsL
VRYICLLYLIKRAIVIIWTTHDTAYCIQSENKDRIEMEKNENKFHAIMA